MSDVFKNRLQEQVLIFDGAMGTELYKHNVFVNVAFEELSLSSPDLIRDIHKSYVDAGADVLTTNTYGANANKLSRFGLHDKMADINRAAVKLAREAGNEDTLVGGSVGPVGDINFKEGLEPERIVKLLTEQARTLESAGVDFIIFETLPSLRDTEFAIQVAANLEGPYVLSFAVDRHCESAKGEPIQRLLQTIKGIDRKPVALGLNCGNGPEPMLNALEIMLQAADYPVIVEPNAGLPKNIDNRVIYMTSPEYFTTYARRYIELGVRGIGGCCGTGPEHIQDMARSVRPLVRSEFSRSISLSVTETPLQEPVPTAEKSPFGAKLAAGEWVATVEIVPPRGYQLEDTIAKAKQCKEAGIDAINIPDGPRASSRVSPMITALQIQEQAGIEAILHFCCRDKNLIGMQADILGCSAAGVNNILFITGDPPKLGDYPFASAVFDVDSIGMVKIMSRLNRGVDIGGKAVSPPTKVLIGVGADPSAIDPERELNRTREKIDSGAEYIITQPVFAIEPLLEFIDKLDRPNTPVIAGIWPLASFRNAEFMRNEVPGVTVPDTIMERMAKAESKEDQLKEGIAIAMESVQNIRHAIRGIQVSAPFGKVATALAVIRG